MKRLASKSEQEEREESGDDSPIAHEGEEDDEREITPPPLIPNPPWLNSPAPVTPKHSSTHPEDDLVPLLPNPVNKNATLCISPHSSHLHQTTSTFLTPARATGSAPRPFDSSFPEIPPPSSPNRNATRPLNPVTPEHDSSSFRSIFQTPLFAKQFSSSTLEEELARMSKGDESPGGFFKRSDLYSSPAVPGSSPSRWDGH